MEYQNQGDGGEFSGPKSPTVHPFFRVFDVIGHAHDKVIHDVQADDEGNAGAFAVACHVRKPLPAGQESRLPGESWLPGEAFFFTAEQNRNEVQGHDDNGAPGFARRLNPGEGPPEGVVKAVVALEQDHAEQPLHVVQGEAEQVKGGTGADAVQELEGHKQGKPHQALGQKKLKGENYAAQDGPHTEGGDYETFWQQRQVPGLSLSTSDAELVARYKLLPPADKAIVDEIINALLLKTLGR
ncbi:hypothetical protein AGMMS49546_29060 [Spirochaetia bacterium]|nr:hypothetical protein AGMMS49546_29060 [Spirochaetia bacterium]